MFKMGDMVEIRLPIRLYNHQWNGTQMLLERYNPKWNMYYGSCIKTIATNPEYIVIGSMLQFRSGDFVEIEHV